LNKTLIALALLLATQVQAADNNYAGISITVPFTFDGVGAQFTLRHGAGEFRAGLDSNGNGQLGAGLVVGGDVTGSFGIAGSSYQNGVVPYGALEAGGCGGFGGLVTYGLEQPTSYVYGGTRINCEDDNNVHTNILDDNGTGGDTGGDDGSDGDSGGSGGSGGHGDEPRCGRDYGNCGVGKGRGGGNGTGNEGQGNDY